MNCNESVIKTHYNSLQSITFQHSQIQFCIKIAKNHYNSLQSITTHYNPLHFITNLFMFLSPYWLSHYSSLQVITTHYNPLQIIKKDAKSPFKPLPISPSHSRNSPLKDLNHFFLLHSITFFITSLPL